MPDFPTAMLGWHTFLSHSADARHQQVHQGPLGELASTSTHIGLFQDRVDE